MEMFENTWARSLSRRRAFQAFAAFLGSSPLVRAQQDPFRDHSRVPGLKEMVTAFDFEPVAYAKLPRAVYDYTAYGCDSEFTLRRNRQAFEWVELAKGAPVDPSSIKTATTVLGTPMAFPIMIAPTAAHLALHPEGESATRRGATAASATPMILSNNTSQPVDKVAAAAPGPLWFQLYPRKEVDENRPII